jgi:hypothetical protein
VLIWGTGDTTLTNATSSSEDFVWSDPQSWANVLIWGTEMIGITVGDVLIWGTTGGMTPNTTAWGDLEDGQPYGMVSSNTIVR